MDKKYTCVYTVYSIYYVLYILSDVPKSWCSFPKAAPKLGLLAHLLIYLYTI